MPVSVQLRASPLSDRSQSSLVGRTRMPFPCKEEKGFMTTEFSCFQVKGKPVLTAFELQLFFLSLQLKVVFIRHGAFWTLSMVT